MASARTLRAGKAVIELSLLSTNVEKGLKRVQSKMRDFGTSLKSIGSTGLKLSGSMAALLAIPIRLAANMEKTRAEFTALIGDAKTANKVISELEGFALVTPLAVSDLADATRTLLNFGVAVEDVVPTIKRLGEISGGDSERMSRLAYAFGQVTAAGRLMGTEVRQFIEAGFNPLQEISRTTGESMESLRGRLEAGQISVDEVAKAFQSATGAGGRFNGLLAKIGGTAIGKFNELKESLIIAIRPIGDALLPLITEYIEKVQELVPVIAKWVSENGETIRTVGKLTALLVLASGAIVTIGTVASSAAALMNPWVIGIGGAVLALKGLDSILDKVNEKLGTHFELLQLIPGAKFAEQFGKMFAKAPVLSPGQLNQPAMNSPSEWYGGSGAAAGGGAGGKSLSLFGMGKEAIRKAMIEAQALALRAQFEAIPVNDMIERAKLAFDRMREIGEEGQRLEDEIARTRIEGMQDGLAKEQALLALEKQIRLRELQEAGLLTPEMRAKLDALFGAQAKNAGLNIGGQAIGAQSTFGTEFASQQFGGRREELDELRKIARNTDPRNQQQAGGLAVV